MGEPMFEMLQENFLNAVYVAILLSSVPVGTGLVLGLIVSVLQAATQIQEQCISFAVKALGIGAVLYCTGGILGAELQLFTKEMFMQISELR